MGIDAVNLGRIDLNLLVHLDALLTERGVTRAAARVGMRCLKRKSSTAASSSGDSITCNRSPRVSFMTDSLGKLSSLLNALIWRRFP